MKQKKVFEWLQTEMKVSKIRFPNTSSIGIKPISIEGTSRLVRAAINYAIANNRKSVTIVHKGNIMKFIEGVSENGGMNWPKRSSGTRWSAGTIAKKILLRK